MTQFWHQVLPRIPANHPYILQSYVGLEIGKKFFRDTFKQLNIPAERQALFLVMGMIETPRLQPAVSRGSFGRGVDACSVFNLSEDLLRSIGYRGANVHKFDLLIHFSELLDLMNKGIEQLGAINFLRFVHGGRNAYENPKGNDACNNYLGAVATGLRVIAAEPKLLRDDRRIEMRMGRQ